MRIVIDANVLISSLVVPAGVPGRLMRLVRQRDDIEVILSAALVAEYRRASSYPKLQQRIGYSPAETAEIIDALRSFATFVGSLPDLDVVKDDPDDNLVVATAVSGNADFIVSGDRHLLSLQVINDIVILSPSAFPLML